MVVLTFQLLLDAVTVFFFLSCFLSFIFSLSVSILFFRRIFRFFPHSHSLFPPPSTPDKKERPFVFLQTIRSTIPRSWLTKKYGLFCGLKDFALIDVLVSWKL